MSVTADSAEFADGIPTPMYIEQLLRDVDSITSEQLPLENDFDFVMSIKIVVEYDCKSSGYELQLFDGVTSKNGYSIPNMKIYRVQALSPDNQL